MQRQKSILSFLHKSSLENQSSGGLSSRADELGIRDPAKQEPNRTSIASKNSAKELFADVTGTDTPPEKIRRSFFPATDVDGNCEARPFSSIMHKFARDDGSSSCKKRTQDDNDCFSSGRQLGKLDENPFSHANDKHEMPVNDWSTATFPMFDGGHKVENPPHFDLSSDFLGPETPAMRPLVPRLKRVQEDCRHIENMHNSLHLESSKRVKSSYDSMIENEIHREVFDSSSSKFEWLNPSSIRDVNGRRPSDPLYDKRTLYIPPDALKKMSASQKQYWSVKCQYMDIVLFFKVGKFYELYELDAEIGQRELDWKMTISGVGKCRQVGVSEYGIDDAVQKLIARGYKVGRMEQLETSGQAKARGSTADHDVKDSDAETISVLVELFVGKASEWSEVIHALNCIDVLQSFAVTSVSSFGSMSRPVLWAANADTVISQQDNGGPILKIKGLWHPYAVGVNGNGVVPNDINHGEDTAGRHPRALLLTGPNMGGKSTLLRATCLAVIMAQIGCYVPCDMCVLSPADVIFTRLGATDRIMSGESTFFVECSETASVLRHATQDSLVLLDELGRGTSTFDGYAIAYAVFRHLVETVCCRLLFATHYHPLTKEFGCHPHVSLQHMACAFNPRSDGQNDLVFLYRLASGPCPESYGLQVALMAGVPTPVVEAASKASQRMKLLISNNFKSSEGRSEFSTLHEEWLKTLLAISSTSDSCCWDEDASDTLLCLWHEAKSFYRSNKKTN